MHQSKVSNFSQSKFPSFGISQISHNISTMNASSAPGFINIQCPSHPQYFITNICRAQCCIEPLCPQCIPGHIQLHQQTKQPSRIETIVAARVGCIQKLAEEKYYLEADLQKIHQEYFTDPEIVVAELKTKLTNSKTKLIKLIDKLYDQMNEKVDVIYSAYCCEADKNLMEARKISNPLAQHLDYISTQKQQLESDGFISTLIEMLTDFPKRPEYKQSKKSPNYGSVEVNPQLLEDIHRTIEKYTHVVVNCKQQAITPNRITSIKSNNSKFSRLSAEKSRVTERSRSRERSIFDSKLIQTNTGSVLETYYNQPSEFKVYYEPVRSTSVQITQPDYFLNRGTLAYFEDNTRTLHTVDVNRLEEGFMRRELNINFLLPRQHGSLVTPENEILLFGGRINEIATNRSFVLSGDTLAELAPMNSERYDFGICYHEDSVYVAGGCQAQGNPMSKFQRYNIKKKCWTVLKPCIDANYGCELTAFNHFIAKIGGRTPNGLSNSIQLYNIEADTWSVVTLDAGYPLPVNSGFVQTASNELLVFGGYIKESKTNEVFVIKFNGMQVSIQKSVQIYSDSTFTNPVYVSKRGLLALQNTAKGTGKNILRFNGTSWKFVSC